MEQITFMELYNICGLDAESFKDLKFTVVYEVLINGLRIEVSFKNNDDDLDYEDILSSIEEELYYCLERKHIDFNSRPEDIFDELIMAFFDIDTEADVYTD